MSTSHRAWIGWVVLATLALTAGCAPRSPAPETLTRLSTGTDTWTGKSRDDVLAVLGEPTRRESDGKGGTVLHYTEIRTRKVNVTFVRRGATASPADDRSGDPAHEQTFQRPSQETERQASFWIDDAGKVYRYWFAPVLYDKGTVPRPPADTGNRPEPGS